MAMTFELDLNEDSDYTTSTCYGCTPVFMVSGQIVSGAHFLEYKGKDNQWKKGADDRFRENVLAVLDEDILEKNKDKLGDQPIAIIFAPSISDQTKLIYKDRVTGGKDGCEDETVVSVIKDRFPNAKMFVVGYYRGQSRSSALMKISHWGRIALEWKAARRSGRGADNIVLNVYAENRWIVRATFDDDGKLLSAEEQTPPSTPPPGTPPPGTPPPGTPPPAA